MCKYYDWKKRYGMENRHNAKVPRDWWLQDWEKQAIVSFYWEHQDEGYRRLAYMMMDADIVAVSATTVRRVLRDAGCLPDNDSWMLRANLLSSPRATCSAVALHLGRLALTGRRMGTILVPRFA